MTTHPRHDRTEAVGAARAAETRPLFFGGGEVGAVMAEWDWSSTAVGPVEEWSPLLQTMVRVVLTSRFSMWMGFGPELTFFYNDAYRRDTLGVKHPSALGRPAWEVWEEIWPDIGPRIDAVLQTGQATWDEALLLFLERSGYPEETYHTFSYSPLSETDGRIVGMLCVVSEETDRVVGERRMATLRRLASEVAPTRDEAEVYAAVDSRLSENLHDLPFTLTYVFDEDQGARLVSATGIAAGHQAAPPVIDPTSPGPAWPVTELLADGASITVDGLGRRFGDLPTGAWTVPPDRALVVPLSQQTQPEPAGFLVAGVNPYRPLDAGFVGFVELLASQIAGAIASARAYEAERTRAEALAELDRAKTEFFSNVSHEFRTPLTLILGPAEDSLNDDRDALPERQAERMEVIRRNARRLRRLVNDMLDFARIEGGRLQAETVAVDLSELTGDIVSSFAPAIERAGLSLVVDCPELPRPVYVDPEMWEKILLNLLSNALKFTMTGTIAVSLADTGDRVRLVVTDSGVGVAPDQLPLLFQRFHRAPRTEARSHEGTGIGLALVHELVRLHGGEVGAASEEGRGSTFTVEVPYGTAATGSPVASRESSRQAYLDEALQWTPHYPEAPAPSHPVRVGGDGSSVLVVDDNPDMRAYISRLLRPFWAVDTASDGQEALDRVARSRPDLVLTDVMMPRLDGFGLLQALRADPTTATVPVIFLSARAGEDAAVEGLDAGADDYLVKPFSALELLARVRSNLELAGLRNEETAWRRALVESLSEGVAVVDGAGTVLEVNPAFEAILGFGQAGAPYRPPFPWLPDRYIDREGQAGQALAAARRDGQFHGVVRLCHRDGHELLVDLTVDSVALADETRFVATLRDVTAELVAAERESALAQLGMQLAESSHVVEVQQAGLTALCRVFGVVRAVLRWPTGGDVRVAASDGSGPGDLAPWALRALEAADAAGQVVSVGPTGEPSSGDGPVLGVAAPLAPGAAHGGVWLELDQPRRITADERALIGVLCGYVGQALRRAQLFDESQAVATAMQRAILGPSEVPSGVAVRYVPAVRPLEVGGDWYDAVELADGRLGLVVGDCVGRGLEAATVMGQLRSACRVLLLQAGDPAQILMALDAFAARVVGADCTTVFCVVLDPRTGVLHYSSAGHLPGIVVGPAGQVTMLSGAGSLPLGVVVDTVRPEATATVDPGSSLLLFTDGLVERRHESLDTGIERLVSTVRSRPGLGQERLADDLMARMLPAEGQRDDVALVIYRRADEPAPFTATIPADPGRLAPFRHALADWLAGAGVDDQEVTEIVIACGEACSNATEHAYGFDADRTVEVTARIVDHRLEVVVADTGQWHEAGAPSDERGRGLVIMERLMDGVAIERHASGTTVRLHRELGHG